MVRKWTDEQRAAASRRAKESGLGVRSGTKASVAIEEVPPVGASAEVFLADHEGVIEKSVDQFKGEDGNPVTTTHTRPGTTVMYKPTEKGRYVPRTVSVSALRLLIRQGWQEMCPDCNDHHLNKDGVASTDPNLCTAREPLAVRVCPVCQKRIYDNVRFDEQVEGDDPNVIQDVPYEQSTPGSRTQVSLNLHLWTRHPRTAQMMNVPPLPAAMAEVAEEVRVG